MNLLAQHLHDRNPRPGRPPGVLTVAITMMAVGVAGLVVLVAVNG